ncbi:hypothetical protein L1987_79576 [Smallanthus sonchifolius]|uniref:Uncharacterized protein n=2 Tax=Smallanthus sonchifolius TaxID=185202 RepID=A0ACB8ZGX0_9ASTR|nr:hypothetical protein L1987_79574 [Smallanthus sonchifolius]KAI3696557.1 hypothetical protein L1987_79576 [Smallanthus sonchifolius]
MQENQGGNKVQTELPRVRVDEDDTMMGENEVIAGDTSLHRSLEESTSDMQEDGKDVWDELCMRSGGVKRPDPWGQPIAPDCDNNGWSLALQRAKVSWTAQGMEVCPEIYTDIIKHLTQQVSTVMGNKACWLDVERENCHQEEAMHRKKKKKQKSKGNNPFNNMQGKEPDHVIAPFNLLGMGEFKTGHAKSKDPIPKSNIKESHMSRMDNLFEDLVARRAKLKTISSNINTTAENNLLVKSLLAMKCYKVLKFSAKINETGQVTIDENMVELDKVPDSNIATHNENKYTQVHEGRSGHQRNNVESGGIIYERNIVNRPTRSEPPVSGINNNLESKQESINQQRHNNPQGSPKNINGGMPNKPRVHTNEEKEPTIELIETSNRFCLLDTDGNELPSIQDRIIYEFGAGTLAVTHERMNMIDTSNNDHENVEMIIVDA